jgi:hypothetical protein
MLFEILSSAAASGGCRSALKTALLARFHPLSADSHRLSNVGALSVQLALRIGRLQFSVRCQALKTPHRSLRITLTPVRRGHSLHHNEQVAYRSQLQTDFYQVLERFQLE